MNYDQLGPKGIFRLLNLKYLRAEHHLRKLLGEDKRACPKCSLGVFLLPLQKAYRHSVAPKSWSFVEGKSIPVYNHK